MGRRSRSPFAVLGLVAQTSKSGYDISRMFERARFLFWNESYGQIYPALKKLHEGGLVDRHREEREVGPTKKIYTLTEEGEEELARWLRKPPGTTSMRDEVALRVTFGEHTNPEIIRALLEQERTRVTELADDLQKEEVSDLNTFEHMGFGWAERYIEMRSAWVDECLEKLDDMTESDVPARKASTAKKAPAKKAPAKKRAPRKTTPKT
jgi:PadR family transcriptional regulator AphA